MCIRDSINSITSVPATPALDLVDRPFGVEHNDVEVVTVPPGGDTAQMSSSPSQRVCFDVAAARDRSDEPDVDVVVYLPHKHSETWLDEWSDLDNDDLMSVSGAKSLDNEVFPLSQL